MVRDDIFFGVGDDPESRVGLFPGVGKKTGIGLVPEPDNCFFGVEDDPEDRGGVGDDPEYLSGERDNPKSRSELFPEVVKQPGIGLVPEPDNTLSGSKTSSGFEFCLGVEDDPEYRIKVEDDPEYRSRV